MSATSAFIGKVTTPADDRKLRQLRHKECGDWQPCVLKWYNAIRGFGFVTFPDGTDAFLHASVFRAAGFIRYIEGMPLEARVYKENGRNRVGYLREAP